MSNSKFDLGGFPSKSKTDGGQLQSNPLAPRSAGANLLNPLTPNSSSSSSSPLGVGDLLPTPSSGGSLNFSGGFQGQPAAPSVDPILAPVQPAAPAQPPMAPVQPAISPIPQEDQEQYDPEATLVVHLSSVGREKVKVIKIIRAHWNLGLKDSKRLADSAPLDLPALPEAQARAAEADLSALGASVSVASAQPRVESTRLKVLHLHATGSQKIGVIKTIRAHWDLGLKESKELVDHAPQELPPLPESKALAAAHALRAQGAVIS